MLTRKQIRSKLLICVFLVLLFELTGYVCNYFLYYPAKSIEFVEMSFNFKDSLQTAIDQSPEEVLFAPYLSTDKAHLQFYHYLVENPKNIPVKIVERNNILDLDNKCLLYYSDNQSEVNDLPYTFIELRNEMRLGEFSKFIKVKIPNARIKVRCFEKKKIF